MIHILEKGEKADPLCGIDTEIITDEMIEALQQGKRLYITVNNEYAVVIKKDGKRKTDKPEETDTDTISRQKGQWIPCTKNGLPLSEMAYREGQKWYGYKCSRCNCIYKGNALTESPYCKNCGADMQS